MKLSRAAITLRNDPPRTVTVRVANMVLFPLVLWAALPRSFVSVLIYPQEATLALGVLGPVVGLVILVGGGLGLGVIFATSFRFVYQVLAAIVLSTLVCVQQDGTAGIRVVAFAVVLGVLFSFFASKAKKREAPAIKNDTDEQKTEK